MANGYSKILKPRVMAVKTRAEALLELLSGKGSDEDRWRDLEILYGITSRLEVAIVTRQLDMMDALLKQTLTSAETLYKNAQAAAKVGKIAA